MQQNCHEDENSCSSIIQQTVDVGLPISLLPLVDLGNVKILCNGEPRMECCRCVCGCGGLELKITQTITYKIPIDYHAEISVGNITSECKKSVSGMNCTQCRY